MIDWLSANWGQLAQLAAQHLWLSFWPIVVGAAVSVPLGALASRLPWLRSISTIASSVLYTIPSLAMFLALPAILGTRILDPINVVVALSIYAVALMTRTAIDAFAAVPASVRASATALGFSRLQQMVQVELPLAIPTLVSGLRVVAVSTISLVSVGALIGVGGLGMLFTAGYQRNDPGEILAGMVTILLLAFAVDALLLLFGRALTPWRRRHP